MTGAVARLHQLRAAPAGSAPVGQPRQHGHRLADEAEARFVAPVEAALDRQQGGNAWATVSLKEGKNREVRRLMEFIGVKVNRLIRVSFGPFHLGLLKEGAVDEIAYKALKEQLGLAGSGS